MTDDDKGLWLRTIVSDLDTDLLNAAATPNDLTVQHLAACQEFSEKYPNVGFLGLVRFVEYIVEDWHGATRLDYVNDIVVHRKRPPSQWRFRKSILRHPTVAEKEWSTMSVSAYLDRFDDLGGERWFVPLLSTPRLHSGCYQPGIVFRNLRYYQSPEFSGFTNGRGGDLTQLTDADMPIAIRRLLAKRLGWNARSLLLEVGAIITVDGLVTAAKIDVATMSTDAKQALEAIVIEMDGVGGTIEKADRCVGEGPDDLYR